MLKINWDTLTEDLTPTELRTGEHLEWLLTLVKPIKTIDNVVTTHYDTTIYDVQHNSQSLSLEHYLNEYFGLPFPVTIPNSIYIDDGLWLDELYAFNFGQDANSDLNNYGSVNATDPTDGQMYIFDNSESMTGVTEQIYLYSNDEYNDDQIDFIVYVYGLWVDSDKQNQITEIVNFYKKIGKTFKIVRY